VCVTRLQNLRTLNLDNNKLAEIPEKIGALMFLEDLVCIMAAVKHVYSLSFSSVNCLNLSNLCRLEKNLPVLTIQNELLKPVYLDIYLKIKFNKSVT